MTYKEAMEIYYINAEIKSLQEELAQHERDRRYYKTYVLSDMPKGKGGHINPTDKYLIKEQELKDMLRYSLGRLQEELIKFEAFLSNVEDAEIQAMLRLRCINNLDWQKVGEQMCMDRTTASRKLRRFFAGQEKDSD